MNEISTNDVMNLGGGLAPVFLVNDKHNEEKTEIKNTVSEMSETDNLRLEEALLQGEDKALQTSVLSNENDDVSTPILSKDELLQEAIFDDDSKQGNFRFLQTSQNLELKMPNSDLVDEKEPLSGFEMAGKMIKEALDVRNYWEAVNRIGEETARYKWAYDEGELGEFDALQFSKETGKAFVRTAGSTMLNTAGSMLSIFGANLATVKSSSDDKDNAGEGAVAKSGKMLQRLGNALKNYADNVENAEILAPSEAIYDDNPNYMKLANIIGSGASQVYAMKTVAKALGTGATYGLFTLGGAGEIFDETMEKTGDVKTADALALTNAGVTFAIDKLFDPLPKTIAKDAKHTSKLIAKEMIGAPLREAGSEVLQQMLAENLVRQVGLDDTQDLFEGLLESAIGAIAGSSFVAGTNAGVYFAGERLDRVKKKILDKGVSAAQIEMTEQGMLDFMAQNPQAFQKVLENNFNQHIKALEEAGKLAKDKKEARLKNEAAEGFPKVYEELYKRSLEAFKNEQSAKIAAATLSSGLMSVYEMNNEMTPQKILEKYLPNIRQMSYAEFRAKTNPNVAVSYMFGGKNAKNADLVKLSEAINLDANDYDEQYIWRKTGWHFGADNQPRFEISDEDATLKIWEPTKLEAQYDLFVQKEISKLEDATAKTAALLMNFSGGIYEDYYKQFWKYLEDNPPKKTWYDEKPIDDVLHVKYDNFHIIDEIDSLERATYNMYLHNLWNDYTNMSRDFNEDEYKMIRTIWENRRYQHFLRYYWDRRSGKSLQFRELMQQKNDELNDNPQFVEQIAKLMFDSLQKVVQRTQTLKDYHMPEERYFYTDLALEREYMTYVLYSGDFSGDIADRNYRSKEYRKAYSPKTASEWFLKQDKFSFLPEEERVKIAELLDHVEFLYRLDRQINVIKKSEKEKKMKTYLFADANKSAHFLPEKAGYHQMQEMLTVENNTQMKFGDLLNHEKLFENYPQLKDAEVHFEALQDDALFHFYYDADKGYVLEVDARQLDYAGLVEVLLRGATFMVQDIEGFDYALPEQDRRNFMNRQVILAQRDLSLSVRHDLIQFLRDYPVDENIDRFIIQQNLPVSLAGLTESRSVKKASKSKEKVYFEEINYDELAKAVQEFFKDPQTPDEIYLRKRALANLQTMRSLYTAQVMARARAKCGYGAAWLPWGGLTSQGETDVRSMLERSFYSQYELDRVPFWRNYRSIMNTPFSLELGDMGEEYDDYYKKMRQTSREQMENLVKGAYEYGSKTITLFETGDEQAIIHESFHYFWDLLNQQNVRQDMDATDFFQAMDSLKMEFLEQYRITSLGDKYYAVQRKNGEIMPQLQRGFDTTEALTEAAIQELFVDKFVKMIENRLTPSATLGEGMNFYRKFLNNLVGKLEIKPNQVNDAGYRVLKFIKKKIHGGA